MIPQNQAEFDGRLTAQSVEFEQDRLQGPYRGSRMDNIAGNDQTIRMIRLQ